ncbi:MAG: hypothetical protein RSB96_00005, partial [Oscillospiraceae bacterium]
HGPVHTTSLRNAAAVKGANYVGGLYGFAKLQNTLDNGSNSGTIQGKDHVGGLVGKVVDHNVSGSLTSPVIINSFNSGSVSAQSHTGGIAGTNEINIKSCYNTGNISATWADTGGIAGQTVYTLNNKIEQCYNTGRINGEDEVGGLVGYNRIVLLHSYNRGSISGRDDIGGVTGRSGTRNANVSNCYNVGSVYGSISGGVVGYLQEGPLVNCYNTGNVTGNYSVGGSFGNHKGVNNTAKNVRHKSGISIKGPSIIPSVSYTRFSEFYSSIQHVTNTLWNGNGTLNHVGGTQDAQN